MSCLCQELRFTTMLFVLLAASALGCASEQSQRGPSAPSSPASPSLSEHGGSRGDSSDKVNGVIAGLSGTCPDLSFLVGGVPVVTDSRTEFEHSACTALSNGLRVEVQGVPRGDGTLMAREVELEEELEENEEARVEGTISGLSGNCPTLSFSINGQAVVTSAATRFKDASCDMFGNGAQATAKGVRQADGSILARELELRENDGHD